MVYYLEEDEDYDDDGDDDDNHLLTERSTAVGKNSTSSQLGNNKVRVEVEKKHSYRLVFIFKNSIVFWEEGELRIDFRWQINWFQL